MPRVLRILNRFNVGGPTYNAVFLSRFMPDEYKTLLIGGPPEYDEATSEYVAHKYGLKPLILPQMKRAIHPLRDRNAYLEIRKIIRDFKPDIVHTHASKAGAVGRVAAFSEGVKTVVHTYHGNVMQGYFSPLTTAFFKGVERELGKRSAALIAISDKQKEELVTQHRIAPAHKVHVIPLGFDLQRFTQNTAELRHQFRLRHQLQETDIAVGIIGRLAPIKQHEVFLRAFALAHRANLHLKAFVIGDGAMRPQLENICKDLNISNAVVFTSWIAEVETVLHALDIIALSSLNEGTPVSLIEASACGKPVVSTRAGGTENAVVHQKTGLLCEVGDAQTFGQHLLTLSAQPDLRASLGAVGRNFVMERYGYQRLTADMHRLYKALLAQ
jgi:glycosyltransferase involved in cell wall biosynthesis